MRLIVANIAVLVEIILYSTMHMYMKVDTVTNDELPVNVAQGVVMRLFGSRTAPPPPPIITFSM